MLKYVLIYLWIYIGVHWAIEAGDADEHVHIKLHMPKSGTRKTVHQHHPHTRRHKKNPPPYAPPPPHGQAHLSPMPAPSAMGSGPGTTHSNVYHETPHNYLTASAGQQSPHYLHGHHLMKRQPSPPVTHLHSVGGGGYHQHQLMDAEFYTSEDGTRTDIAGSAATAGDFGSNADFMLNEYLASNFASFPQPTTFEAEIMSPQTNSELAYHSQRLREEQQRDQHPTTAHHHNKPHHYEAAAAAVDHDVDEDNEILETLGRTTSSLMEDSEWLPSPHQAKPYRGLSTVKTMKNEHLLKHIMQQEQQQQQHSKFPYQPEITKASVASASAKLRPSHGKYRDDKLHKTTTDEEGEGGRDDVMATMNAYDDDMVDMATAYSVGGGQRGGGDDAAGIKALTVDDIWSQLQRTYLNKYTPQAQPARGGDETPPTPSRKRKRNSPKLKTRKRHHQLQHNARSAVAPTPTPTSFSAVRTLDYENNYYNQEHPVKYSSFYDNHHTPVNSYSSFARRPYSYGSSTDTDLFETRATVATRPYHSFNSATDFEADEHDDDAGRLDDDDNVDANADDAVVSYSIDSFNADDDDGETDADDALQLPHSGEDISSEESMFSASHKKFGNNRSHRHSHSSVAYGNANPNSHLNYHDLYASYSTPIAATIATRHVPAVSTYHPNSYNVVSPPSQSQSPSSSSQTPAQTGPSLNHESTSYQWREQQHYPAATYQAYHGVSASASSPSSSSSQQQYNHNRPQHHHQLQYQPQTTSALRLSKAASTVASSLSSSSSLSQHHPLTLAAAAAASSPPSSPSSTAFSANDFTAAVKQSSGQQQQQQQRYKKRKNRLKSKRNRIVVT